MNNTYLNKIHEFLDITDAMASTEEYQRIKAGYMIVFFIVLIMIMIRSIYDRKRKK